MKSLLFALFVLVGASAGASNYPPDYPLTSDRNQTGPVEVTRNLGFDWIGMRVTYAGILNDHPGARAGKLRVWIKLNGNEATFPMRDISNRYGHLSSTTISRGPLNCHMSLNGNDFQCDDPTAEMRHVLFWAKPEISGLNANAWDLQIAFYIDGTHVWDNNGQVGGNYPLRFEPYGQF